MRLCGILRVVMWEARRAIFNNESLAHIFVECLVLGGEGGVKGEASEDKPGATDKRSPLVEVVR